MIVQRIIGTLLMVYISSSFVGGQSLTEMLEASNEIEQYKATYSVVIRDMTSQEVLDSNVIINERSGLKYKLISGAVTILMDQQKSLHIDNRVARMVLSEHAVPSHKSMNLLSKQMLIDSLFEDAEIEKKHLKGQTEFTVLDDRDRISQIVLFDKQRTPFPTYFKQYNYRGSLHTNRKPFTIEMTLLSYEKKYGAFDGIDAYITKDGSEWQPKEDYHQYELITRKPQK